MIATCVAIFFATFMAFVVYLGDKKLLVIPASYIVPILFFALGYLAATYP